ncbi:hypothetical protein SAY87_001399 [Trapa incisa]|uniref:Uncharacterized protein n=1 Tax=Trapa incisa TaxID=236973 RepID=A0AAN7GG29_9MYRT|nr:hypothetical protein SAY87_001399 [Trapa incisa]
MRVLPISLYVAEHHRFTIGTGIIQIFSKGTGKFFESCAAYVCWELGSFALARDDCVVLVLEVNRTTFVNKEHSKSDLWLEVTSEKHSHESSGDTRNNKTSVFSSISQLCVLIYQLHHHFPLK